MSHAYTLDEAVTLLTRTPRVLDALLRDLPEAWTACHEGDGTWSAFDVVGHLIHGERTDWIPRARRLLEHGESRAFDPFGRFAQQEASKGRTMTELLDESARLRAESLRDLAAMQLSERDLDRRGLHPALGPVTLRQLLATWVAHDLDHLMQIARVMAHRYASDVGPWREYLRVITGQPG